MLTDVKELDPAPGPYIFGTSAIAVTASLRPVYHNNLSCKQVCTDCTSMLSVNETTISFEFGSANACLFTGYGRGEETFYAAAGFAP